MHNNPLHELWNLADRPENYCRAALRRAALRRSSAAYCETGADEFGFLTIIWIGFEWVMVTFGFGLWGHGLGRVVAIQNTPKITNQVVPIGTSGVTPPRGLSHSGHSTGAERRRARPRKNQDNLNRLK